MKEFPVIKKILGILEYIILRFKYVRAKTKNRLKISENPKSATTQTQNIYSAVNIPLDLRRTFPTVGSLIRVSGFGCKTKKKYLVGCKTHGNHE